LLFAGRFETGVGDGRGGGGHVRCQNEGNKTKNVLNISVYHILVYRYTIYYSISVYAAPLKTFPKNCQVAFFLLGAVPLFDIH